MLESLRAVTGVESFALSVNPENPSDNGFLGGTMLGRRYWRHMRGGGELGAKGFKSYCVRDLESYKIEEPPPANDPPKGPNSKSLKTELYDLFRKELRTVTGVPNAEMKWTNNERLDVYGVRLVGWPAGIPAANPSSLKATQNKKLLECLENGTLRFEKILGPSEEPPPPEDHATPSPPSISIADDPPTLSPSVQDTVTLTDTLTDEFASRFKRILLPPEEPPLPEPGPSSLAVDDSPLQFLPPLQDAPAIDQNSWAIDVSLEEQLMSTEIMGQPVTENLLGTPEDMLWQTQEVEPIPYAEDFWADVDVNTMFANTPSPSPNPSNSRKRPRTEFEADNIPDFL
ncbi:hypothetical protein H0H92_015075 [Tricholoma furcatifolium]|nr:hypothetical protein H0H92_015075 [Tricholoma furcatifolium]